MYQNNVKNSFAYILSTILGIGELIFLIYAHAVQASLFAGGLADPEWEKGAFDELTRIKIMLEIPSRVHLPIFWGRGKPPNCAYTI